MTSPLRIIFAGTPEFSVSALSALASEHQVVAVLSQPDRPAGRGRQLRASPVKEFAVAQGLPVLQPDSLKSESIQQQLKDLDADCMVVVAYGLILPQQVLDIPRHGCLNIHASLLPRWRGAAPIQRAIQAGDTKTGITIMQMDEGLDTGPVLGTARIAITGDMTASDLHDELAVIGAPLMVDTLAKLAAGEVIPVEQSEEGVTYAKKIDKAEARIDWSRPAKELDCHIRGLSPFPGAYFEIIRKGKPERVKILRAEAVAGSGVPGSALDDKLTIACGEGALRLAEVQRAGKGRATAEEFLRGFPLAKGESVS